MKKEYVKPSFEAVNFDLETNIATSCDIRVAGHGWEVCAVDIGGLGTIFGGPYELNCDFEAEETGLCYFTAVPNNNVFGS